MIDNVKGNSGQGVAMYSRAGKSTINQYLVFSDKSDVPNIKVEPEDDSMNYYDENVERELRIILAKEEELK